ncbi:MAG: type II CAAX endopeptidase family protein [Tissierellia bacterium]|nr:type II CAAX endopeptidase family protein [Tissierellia bacterium]
MRKVKAIGISIFMVLVLVISQLLAWLIGDFFTNNGIYEYISTIIVSFLYPVFIYFILKICLEKLCNYNLKDFYIDKPKLKWYWVLVSIMLPAIVILSFVIFIDGKWVLNDLSKIETISILTFGIIYRAISAGICEEMIFRGAIMGILKEEFDIKIAIIIPSILFGLVHIIGSNLNFSLAMQLLISGTMVGIMFSLIEYESKNFWNNALVHAMWNMSTVGIISIGEKIDSDSLITYITNTNSNLITGGKYGIDIAIFSIIGYFVVSFMAILLIRRKS